MFSKLILTAAAFFSLSVVNAAPGVRTSFATCDMCLRIYFAKGHIRCIAYPKTRLIGAVFRVLQGHFTIGNVESQGGLLFEGSDGKGLVDFRRRGGYRETEIWEIRDAGNGHSEIWNVGTGHPVTVQGSVLGTCYPPQAKSWDMHIPKKGHASGSI
ncbi:hypothetical protein B0H19DRAFT_1233993 [Mycena capillaripes]|nr:hypothetical protein B0H19DRAFT_1233993 [Mycena capillaripes]